jgi:hypothetical protein
MPWMVPLWWKQIWCRHTRSVSGITYVADDQWEEWTQCLSCGRRVVAPRKDA